MNIARLFAAGLVALLVGCTTPYQEMGAMGGVTAAPMSADMWRISARGNGFTDPLVIQDYVLLKAAEVTIQSGNTHFAILSSGDATSRSIQQTAGTFTTNVIGNTAFTTYNPGVNYDIVKPGADLLIQVGKLPPGQSMGGVFDAQQVFAAISPRVRRPS